MKNFLKQILTALSSAVLLFCNSISAFAEIRLPDGVTAGLPEKVAVMDSDGNSVSSSTGEYFFHVEGMSPNETYSKNIQIINLREDKAYHIYFYAEPVSNAGELDLENQCNAVISLNGENVYEGKVTGKGNIDLTQNPLDLGLFEPGESRSMKCSVVWNVDGDINVDYGEKIVSADGTEIVREPDGNGEIYGEVIFKWVFYAVIDEEYTPPKTGILSIQSWGYILALVIVGVMIIIMLILIISKKKRLKDGK